MVNKFYLAGILALSLMIGIASAGTSYIHANGQLIAKINETGNITYYHSDNIGSTSAVTNEAGEAVEQKNLPFGELLEGSEKYGFTSKERDETGLNYFGARHYSPLTGRFLTADPAKDGLNWYSYVNNNPLVSIDPDGMALHHLCEDIYNEEVMEHVRRVAQRDVKEKRDDGWTWSSYWTFIPKEISEAEKKAYKTRFFDAKALVEDFLSGNEENPLNKHLSDKQKANLWGAKRIADGPGTDMEKLGKIYDLVFFGVLPQGFSDSRAGGLGGFFGLFDKQVSKKYKYVIPLEEMVKHKYSGVYEDKSVNGAAILSALGFKTVGVSSHNVFHSHLRGRDRRRGEETIMFVVVDGYAIQVDPLYEIFIPLQRPSKTLLFTKDGKAISDPPD